MRRKLVVLFSMLGWFAFAFALTTRAHAGPMFSELVVFGDSFSENGNLLFDSEADPALQPDPPPPAYFGGRQSNGLIWAEQLADELGIPQPVASQEGGTNYAYSGATSGFATRMRSSIAIPGQIQEIPEIGTQINNYLGDQGAFNDTQLVAIWSGANDLLEITLEVAGGTLDPSDPTAVATRFGATFADVETQLRLVIDNGGEHLLIPNQPDSSQAPFWSGAPWGDPAFTALAPVLGGFVDVYNDYLALLLGNLASEFPDVNIYPVDIYSALEQILFDPTAAGFIDVATPALLVGATGDGFMFWDPIHVTTQTHAAIAALAADALPVPIAPTGAMLLLGMALMRRRLGARAAQSQV